MRTPKLLFSALVLPASSLAVLLPTQGAQAVPCGEECAPPVTTYSIINVTTYHNQVLLDLGRVGSCSNPGGKCTITVKKSVETSVEAAEGVSDGWVSDKLGFSLTQKSEVGESAKPARNLKADEQFRAYADGTQKFYQIRKVVTGVSGTVTSTSALLVSEQPNTNAVDFGIYNDASPY